MAAKPDRAQRRTAEELSVDDKIKRASAVQRALLECYILGVESRMRGKLSRPRRDELRYAWMAGFSAGQTSQSDAARERT